MRYTGRFAPSPTGPLHLGSLVAAMASYLDAQSHDGIWRLRIDDVDTPRAAPGATTRILSQLDAHGLEWTGPVMYQSQRSEAYRAAFEQLMKQELLYACDCSRSRLVETARHGPMGFIYNGTCRKRKLSMRNNAVRICTGAEPIRVEDRLQGGICQQLQQEVGDFVVRRRDGIYAYHLACVVDDAEQGITHIVRGADLLDSTPRQAWLQHLLGYPRPRYAHVPVIINAEGQKLSKQAHARPLAENQAVNSLLHAWYLLGEKALEQQPRDPREFWQMAREAWNFNLIGRQPRYENRPRRQPK